MLVLSRRLNEKIMLPDLDVTFQVMSIKGGVVRIGIDAPKHVGIVREELLDGSKTLAACGSIP
jgi:two-component system, OmpR family, response regulator